MNNIILIGFMGTGKTTVGRALARRLGWAHVDLDAEIERAEGMSIPSLFREKGEAYFRDAEARELARVLKERGQVVTTGGGAVLRPANVQAMLAGGTVVALFAAEEEIIRRVAQDTGRPLLAGGASARVRELLRQREGAYDFAPIRVDTTARDVEEIVEEIIARAAKTGFNRGD